MADDKIRIEWGDLKSPKVDARLQEEKRSRAASVYPQPAGGATDQRVFGQIAPLGSGVAASVSSGRSFVFSGLFYYSMAGLAGALIGWMVSEPIQRAFPETQGSVLLLASALFFGLVGAVMGFGLGAIENFMSGMAAKGFISGGIGLGLGFLGGAIAGLLGQVVFGAGAGERQSIALVLDVSGSMTGEPLTALKESASRFLSTGCDKGLSFSLVSFSDNAKILVPLTREKADLVPAVDKLAIEELTNMPEGLRQGLDSLRGAPGKRTLVLFTDGQPNFLRDKTQAEEMIKEALKRRNLTEEEIQAMPEDQVKRIAEEVNREIHEKVAEKTREETLKEADKMRQSGVRVIAIGAGKEVDRGFLEKIATDSSQVFLTENKDDISEVFRAAENLLFRKSRSSQQVSVGRVLLRSVSWSIVGLLLGLAQGLAMGSGKKIRNGLIGGFAGGLAGGLLFDVIGMAVHADWLSRLVALCVIGGLMGLMIGLVENLLKDAWLLVTSGPLSGKQFVLYKNPTIFGSSPKADLYLFKDPDIAPCHAAVHITSQGYVLADAGAPAGTSVNGQRVTQHKLRPGDNVQMGRYVFAYAEKARQSAPGGMRS